MISEIISKDKCTGCELCANVCNHNAIKMVSDDMGFYYPDINEACIECNLCKIKCDERLIKTNNYLEPETYAAWSKDKDIRYNSTSGGLFSELANEIIRMGGCVVGAQYSEDNLVEHVLVENLIGIEKIRQSKYIQSRSGNIYQIVKKMLNENRYVAFCGTPCQVAALNSYLGHKSFEKLITIDFICRGVNSPKAFKAWLNEIENSNNSKVVKVWFKYKEGGWKTSPKRTRLDFKNGNFKIKDGKENLFMYGYLTSNLYIRPSCGDCDFKGIPRQSDITLADFWGIESKLDDDKGTSLVLINNEKGKALFNRIENNVISYKRNFSEIFEKNVCFNSSVEIPSESEKFLRELSYKPFSKVLSKYDRIFKLKKWKRRFKKVINLFRK